MFYRLLFFSTHPAHSNPILIQYLFSLSSFPHLNLAIITLSFLLSLPRYFGSSSVIIFSYFPLYLDSLIDDDDPEEQEENSQEESPNS
jgi:hypothetical protein